ncbi:hypothetical protein HQQ80_19220 [Microbacteriaceae bacterium VKM Ac-2855]|nr:hypothetical protein [Microbacteriaceae bacterium VKM Ac-2855]
MERISYAGDSVVTGTAIAHALLAYAEALAMNEASATVELPILLEDGTLGRASILIGPASQLISRTEPGDAEEITDDALLDRLVTTTAALGISRPVASEHGESATYDLGDLDIVSYDRPEIVGD